MSEGQKEKEGKEERAAAAAGDVTHGRAGVCVCEVTFRMLCSFLLCRHGAQRNLVVSR